MMKRDPTAPKAWGIALSQMWGPRFPVDVRQIALEYSTRYPDPIRHVAKADVDTFEGALYPLKKTGGWAILYNPSISSIGRINYTLAHELGHYLVHRAEVPAGFECGQRDVLGDASRAALRQKEQEADQFASFLLMPLDDFREQVGTGRMTLDLLRHCADRYEVSLTAAALKWVESTSLCAAVVVATNGFVLWSRPSTAARKRGIYFATGTELPQQSVAARGEQYAVAAGVELPRGVWTDYAAREVAIFADKYEMTISLLVFDADAFGSAELDEEPVEDAYEHMVNRGR